MRDTKLALRFHGNSGEGKVIQKRHSLTKRKRGWGGGGQEKKKQSQVRHVIPKVGRKLPNKKGGDLVRTYLGKKRRDFIKKAILSVGMPSISRRGPPCLKRRKLQVRSGGHVE